MAVHQSRRLAPLPSDIEFASLDSTSSGFSLIESAFSSSTSQAGSIEIVPLVKLGLIHGLDGVSSSCFSLEESLDEVLMSEEWRMQPHISYGPFTPPQKTSVPLWLAIHLKKKRKCRIIPPKWLSTRKNSFSFLPLSFLNELIGSMKSFADYLEGILKEEQSLDEFADLPRDYLEVSKILLDSYVPPFPSRA